MIRRGSPSDEETKLFRAALLKYRLNLPHKEVQKRLGAGSLSTVTRTLEQAADRGIVTTHYTFKVPRDQQLETEAIARLGGKLREIVAYPLMDEPDLHSFVRGLTAASVLSQVCRERAGRLPREQATGAARPLSIGVTGGQAIGDLAKVLEARATAEPLALNGIDLWVGGLCVSRDGVVRTSSTATAARLAELLGSHISPEPHALLGTEALQAYDLLLLGIGARGSKGYAATGEAVGEILFQGIDHRGEPVTENNPHVLATVDLHALRQYARDRPVIAIADGERKVDAIAAACRGGFLSMLVTDVETLRKVIQASSDDARASAGPGRGASGPPG